VSFKRIRGERKGSSLNDATDGSFIVSAIVSWFFQRLSSVFAAFSKWFNLGVAHPLGRFVFFPDVVLRPLEEGLVAGHLNHEPGIGAKWWSWWAIRLMCCAAVLLLLARMASSSTP
jgi:hypothetical protein